MTPTFQSLAAHLLIVLPGRYAYAVPADMEDAAQTLISRATRKGGPALISLAEADDATRQTAERNLIGHTAETYRQALAAGPLSPVCNPVRKHGGARRGSGPKPAPDAERHTERITLTCTPAEKARLQQEAAAVGASANSMARARVWPAEIVLDNLS